MPHRKAVSRDDVELGQVDAIRVSTRHSLTLLGLDAADLVLRLETFVVHDDSRGVQADFVAGR